MEKVCNPCFIARDRFDVDEVAGKRDEIHGEENILPAELRNGRVPGGCPSQQSPAGVCYCDVLHRTSTIRSLFLDGPAGRLEALLNAGSDHATHAALVCHPHPLYGGTLHNKVVFHTMKALNSFGFPVLRFNFRGTGLSQGEHDNGIGEVDDVHAALDWLDREFHLPVIFAGFSFGAAVGLRAACPDPPVQALIGLGLPAVPAEGRSYDLSFLQTCSKAKLFVSGARDEFGPRVEIERLVQSLAEPKKLVLVDGADHFFEGRLRELLVEIVGWVKEVLVAIS